MTPDQWEKLDRLYNAAVELPAEHRDRFLTQACADDEDLRRQVESLLHAHEQAGSFLNSPILEDVARAAALEQDGQLTGRQVRHYRILSRLGAGGMGEVYRAHDTQLERDVAIKVLKPAMFNDPSARLRLVQEARTASKLNHPNICTIHEVGEADGHTYIAMELVEGRPLSARLADGALSLEEALALGLQMAEALAHAHSRRVVHRDFKSGNVMVTAEGRAKVLDFGLAKTLRQEEVAELTTLTHASLTQPGVILGTLAYMAPEQLRGQSADARSDVWALGVVLYEMVSGVRPFQGKTTIDLSSSILSQSPAPLPSGIPAKLRKVIQRCLEKSPEARYADGSEVRRALEKIRNPAGPHTGWPGHLARHRRTYAIPLALVLLAAGWGITKQMSPDEPRPGKQLKRTSFDGWEYAPSWSPDGSTIAYTHIVGGSADVATLTPGKEPQVLTAASPFDEFLPRWSPTGDQIVYISDHGSGTNIYWIPKSGGAEHFVAETRIPFLQRMGAWSGTLGSNPWNPDGTKLVFSRLEPSGGVALWIRVLGTGVETRLSSPPPGSEDGDAAWSPDGKQIAFDRVTKGITSMWLIPANGGKESQLLEDAFMPAWQYDSRRLVFSSARNGPVNLWEVNLATTKLRQLTIGAGTDWTPAVNRDGSIAYSQFRHDVDVYWGAIDDHSDQHDKIVSSTGENFGPRVSPDGKQVLYSSNRTGDYEVWIYDKRTGKHRNLTNQPSSDRLADWSPTGKEIVFLSDRGGAVRLWIVNTESGIWQPQPLIDQELPWASHTAEAEGAPRWSPDGNLIGYLAPATDGNAIWVVGKDGSHPHATPIRNAFSFGWYKDGSDRLLYIRQAQDDSGLQELRAANLKTNDDQPILKRAMAELAVSPDGRALSFLDAVSHFTMELYALRLKPGKGASGLPVRDGDPRPITSGKGAWHVHAGGWSPDGNAVVYSRDKDEGDLWVLEPGK